MSILVTGGAGYIGSHMVRALINDGREVVIFDDLSVGHKKAVGYNKLIVGNLLDTEMIISTIKENNVTAVIHYAASTQVGESMIDPEKYYINNMEGTLSLLKAMRQTGVDKIVFSSTAATYGNPKKLPIDENCPQNPTSVYGRTKLMMENMIADYNMAYGLKYIALRYFNVAGADECGDIGEDHNPESHLIPVILGVLLGKRDSINIFGTDYPTKDGTCVRDYVHITDLCNAHLLALKALENGMEANFYNLGSGGGFSVKEVIDEVEKVTGLTIKRIETDRRSGDPALLIASSDKIQKELNWTPKQTNMYDIISSAWKWHKNHPDGYEE